MIWLKLVQPQDSQGFLSSTAHSFKRKRKSQSECLGGIDLVIGSCRKGTQNQGSESSALVPWDLRWSIEDVVPRPCPDVINRSQVHRV